MNHTLIQVENHKNYNMELNNRITKLLEDRQKIQNDVIKTTLLVNRTTEKIANKV